MRTKVHISVPHDNETRWRLIKQLLTEKNLTIAAIAAQHNLKSKVLTNTKTVWSHRQQKRIADALNMSPQELFPERYDEYGIALRNCEKSSAA